MLVAAAVGMSSAVAADAGAGWYLGTSVGWTWAKFQNTASNAALISTGATPVYTDQSNHDTGYKLFGGYQFNKNLAVEGGYFSLGSLTYNSVTTDAAGTLHIDARNSSGFNLDLVGSIPVGNDFSLLGRVGVQSSETKGNASGTGTIVVLVPVSSNRYTGFKAGLGAQYDVNKVVGMRAEWERYRISDGFFGKTDVDIFSAGLVFRF